MTPRPEDFALAVETLRRDAEANEACALAALDRSGVYAGEGGESRWHPGAAQAHTDYAHSLRAVMAWIEHAAAEPRREVA